MCIVTAAYSYVAMHGCMYECMNACAGVKIVISTYRIIQIVRSGKLSRFSRIRLQSQRFSSEFFLFYYKVFRIAVKSRKFSHK